jgi:hypothetical protein
MSIHSSSSSSSRTKRFLLVVIVIVIAVPSVISLTRSISMSSAAQPKPRSKKEPLYDESQVVIHPEATVVQDAVFKGKVTIGKGKSRRPPHRAHASVSADSFWYELMWQDRYRHSSFGSNPGA